MQILSVRGALPGHLHPQEEWTDARTSPGIGLDTDPARPRTAVAGNRLARPA